VFPQVKRACQAGDWLGVSLFYFSSRHMDSDGSRLCSSTPNALQYEKFMIPDAIRILDGIVETLTY
jgi:hypothetical protein